MALLCVNPISRNGIVDVILISRDWMGLPFDYCLSNYHGRGFSSFTHSK